MTDLNVMVLIAFLIGLSTGLLAPHIYDVGITAAMPEITIPDIYYPPECHNWYYTKGNGSKKSDYFYDTDPASCLDACNPSSDFAFAFDNTHHLKVLKEKCRCCKARGQI